MKKVLFAALASLIFFACEKSAENFFGTWVGESLTFTVEDAGSGKVRIVNENGALQGEITGGKIVGQNQLGMSFEMSVKGDSAYYTFAGITTGYKRK